MPRAKNAPKAPTMPATALETENGYLRRIVTHAELLGFWWGHIPTSQYKYLSGTQGFPDLVMIHPVTKATLFVEVKLDRGKVSQMQHAFADILTETPHLDYYLVFQKDWERFKRVLEEKAGRIAA